ncbi:pentaheme c-type cytochrome TorC [Photobacterium chitinilyticum]|uniref:Cytochrome c-type protein n=1 Tax=Photobacterium chitinilyticum TaxID=2485123 RepID=A0A3S3RJB0_9GAMM|nr:pentaheme c-type cytochrome TorC [Photobacterium chitinilyticum]RWX56922.1 pentaheme c-type cytochrome TorC [Photobacterium chitinilyticum]
MKSIKQILQHFFTPSKTIGLGILILAGFIGGIGFWTTFDAGLEYTNQEEFCIGCHEMENNVYQELQSTIHFKNRTGVRATCPDCHVPHNFTDKIARKAQASMEVWAKLTGAVDTPEKFSKHRLEMAKREWARMSANGSAECRSCHDYKSMDFEKMSADARDQMMGAAENDQSCIDCHKGIAHHLPDMSAGYKSIMDDLNAQAVETSVNKGNTYYTLHNKKLFLDPEMTKKAGLMISSVPVEVIGSQGEAIEVKITGWRKKKGSGKIIMQDFARNIRIASLQRKVAKTKGFFNVLDAKEDEDTSITWQNVDFTLWTDKKDLVEEVEPIWEYAKEAYTATCSRCHSQPAEAHFDSNTWVGMFKGMLDFADFEKEEEQVVLRYLQMHSSDYSNDH